MNENNTLGNPTGAGALKALSVQDFLAFGINHIAYLKPVMIEGTQVWSIHAADGRPLSIMGTVEEAMAASWQNDLKPVLLH